MEKWVEPALFPDMRRGRFSIRAKKLIGMIGETAARGKDLYKKIPVLENPLVLVEDGLITDIQTAKGRITPGFTEVDLGERCLLPALVNAHTHLQLSFMENNCSFNSGFTGWLEDLIPNLIKVLQNQSEWTEEKRLGKLHHTFQNLRNAGVYYIGDVGGTIPGAISAINALARDDFTIHNFCEWFGFDNDFLNISETWPDRCRREMKENPQLEAVSSPSGHALYSTSLDIIKRAKTWCRKNNKVFSLHLAEPVEEGQCLQGGYGDLFDIYSSNVIPAGWKPYRATPYEVARQADLVDRNSLFVHCIHLEKEEIEDLAKREAAVCLCPRSNENLKVGTAPVKSYIEKGVRICLGTDGLCSNVDLNVLNEALYLKEQFDLPFDLVLRLCTVNGADALGFPEAPGIRPGIKARFSSIPVSLMS